jgi:large subunit ribosomal protein L6
MSRIGKKIIEIPKNVIIEIFENKIIITGPFGKLEQNFLNLFNFYLNNNKLKINLKKNTKISKPYYGLIRTLIQNMIFGVTNKFSKILNLEGIGYKFQIENNYLKIYIGFTHPIIIKIPEDLNFKLETITKLIISGINKEKVGTIAASIRSIKPPEPYKGKGILYENEIVNKKVGKTTK